MAAGVLLAITIIIAVFASGITLPNQEIKTGRLTVLLTDAPVDLDELLITITDLEVHQVGEGEAEGEWINIIQDANIEFNLLEYQNGDTLFLGSVEIAIGKYNKIRMNVSEAEAFFTEEAINAGYENGPLKVPPGKIDVITEFELVEDGSKVVLIDMEPDWVAISKSGNLRPTLKASISEEPSD